MEEVVKEKYLKREPVSEEVPSSSETTKFEDLDAEVKLAIECAEEKKAADTVVLDLRGITSFTEYFIITSGSNQRQVQAIADEILEQLKKQLRSKVIRVEGYNSAEWVLLDYGDFVVHIFNEKSRGFYDLERLWRDAKRVKLKEQ